MKKIIEDTKPISKAALQAAIKTIEAQTKPIADFVNFHAVQLERSKCAVHHQAGEILEQALFGLMKLKAVVEMSILTYEAGLREAGFNDAADDVRASGIAAQAFNSVMGHFEPDHRSGPPTPKPSNDGVTYPGPRYDGSAPYNPPKPYVDQSPD